MLILYLGMLGKLCVIDVLILIIKYDYVDIVLNIGKCLCFNDLRCFGVVLF